MSQYAQCSQCEAVLYRAVRKIVEGEDSIQSADFTPVNGHKQPKDGDPIECPVCGGMPLVLVELPDE